MMRFPLAGSLQVDESIFQPSEPGSPAVWASTPTSTYKRGGVVANEVFGMTPPQTKRRTRPKSDEFEEDDWSNMLLPPHKSGEPGTLYPPPLPFVCVCVRHVPARNVCRTTLKFACKRSPKRLYSVLFYLVATKRSLVVGSLLPGCC